MTKREMKKAFMQWFKNFIGPDEVENYSDLISRLPWTDSMENYNIWTNGESILCPDNDIANWIANFLDNMGYTAMTGYYDPDADRKSHSVDYLTGWYYVEVD